GLSANGSYRFSEWLEAYGSFRTSKNRSWQSAQLSANTLTGGFGSAAVLPAALNPFNQNVSIGMMLPEFGPESQTVRTLADASTAGLRGTFGQTWEWDLGTSWSEQKTRQVTRTYNSAGFLALLT
ncbi:MAG: hypothetical protein ACKPKO_48740, partial [Candidatus Fonsibacter sp.]